MASKTNFGRFFAGKSKSKEKSKKKEEKQKVTKSKSADTAAVSSVHSDSEEDSYEDPANTFPTNAPGDRVAPGGMPMPNYPPPRLNSMNSVITKKRDDYIEPYDSKLSGPISPSVPDGQSTNNYADPFDSKFSDQHGNNINNNDNSNDEEDEYDIPYETTKNIRKSDDKDNYSTPWDSSDNRSVPVPQTQTTDTDNYSAPWDMAKSISNNKKSSVRNINNRQDEYSDPWDAKNSHSPMSQDALFDDTYSEPYDKGKSTIIDEKKRVQESLVDDEIEFSDKEKRWIGVNVSKSDSKNNSPENQTPLNPIPSRVPPPQVISQGDYDAPWDWKVKKIENDFSKACDVESPSATTTTITTTEIKTTGVSEPSHQPEDVTKEDDDDNATGASSNECALNDGADTGRHYQVDPTIPLPNQGWFHGRIRRFEAEELLKGEPDCSYLIRNSESSKIDYSLSIRNNGATIHLRISCKESKYILGVNSRPFDTIPEMIHHYSMNKLNIRGAEQVKLQYPVLQEAVYFTVMPGS